VARSHAVLALGIRIRRPGSNVLGVVHLASIVGEVLITFELA
jgi:hypothetical protein